MSKDANTNLPDDHARLERSAKGMNAWQQAQQALIAGRHASALAGYRKLLKEFPRAAQLWAEMGIATAGELDFAAANQALERAAELAANDADLLVSIGQQYHRLRRLDKAAECFEKAVAAEPSSLHAQLSLAAWFERDRQLDKAWACAETALARHPNDPRAIYFKAFLLHRKGQNSEAETALRNLIKSNPSDFNVRISAAYLLGTVADALGNYAEALDWLGNAKAMQRQAADTAALEQAYDKMDQSRRELLSALTPDMLGQWRDEAASTPSPHPMAFLGGPPRSGTTLIEQVLGAHPNILVFDEPEAFASEALNALYPPPPARGVNLKTLNALSSSARSQIINRYFKSLLRDADEKPAGKMLLDKNPSLTASLHLWLRLFPKLKVIITLRDPRDVIISCYFQNLTLTAANVNFLSLDRAARFYADCMDVWLRMRELGGFEWIESRYEDMVGNLEAEGKRLTEFLGFTWHPAQANYHETSRRKFVFAPTYSDVSKPVYNRAIKRWEHYGGALAPFEGTLTKYVQTWEKAKG